MGAAATSAGGTVLATWIALGRRGSGVRSAAMLLRSNKVQAGMNCRSQVAGEEKRTAACAVFPDVDSLDRRLVLCAPQRHHFRMTRDEALTAYGPIRAGIQRILKAAVHACNDVDWKRAAKQLGAWSRGRIDGEDESAIEMIADVALFEPNQRGKRAYDRFLGLHGHELESADLDLAGRMRGARFSVFRVAGRHELAGVWLHDVLGGDERIWVLDKGLEASAPDDLEFGMRLFDAGPFHGGSASWCLLMRKPSAS